MKEKLDHIFKTFGFEKQIEKLREEVEELYQELFTYDNEEKLIDEMADVYIILSQFFQNSPLMKSAVEYKLDRTVERIESGYYKEARE